MCDENILRKIVEFIHPQKGETVVELGAGTGALTRFLAPLVGRLVAVELDHDLLPWLQEIPNVEILHEDILKLDLARFAPSGRVRVAGNLPYYISTPILTRLIRQEESIQDLVLMFQEEVAKRITDLPSSGDYSYLSALCQYFCRIEKGFRISRNCFRPMPAIESRILKFEFRRDTRCDYAQVSAFLAAAFSQRRKKLINNLSRSLGMDAKRIAAVFASLNIPENARAENLSPGQFESLILKLQGDSPQRHEAQKD